MSEHTSSPSPHVHLLKDGFWETTAVIQTPQGPPLVRKSSRPGGGPWARQTLRREILYLSSLPPSAQNLFPPLHRSWGAATPPHNDELGYEIPYYPRHQDVARLIQTHDLPPSQAEAFQDHLASALFLQLYTTPIDPHHPLALPLLSSHLPAIIEESLEALAALPDLRPLVDHPHCHLNGRPLPGLRRLWNQIASSALARRLDEGPQVRLHGDLILENILCLPPSSNVLWWEEILLIDPVSVAGIAAGPPLFDLVKFASYACGELLAIREETCTAGPTAPHHYQFHWDPGAPHLSPFRHGRWHHTFRLRFEDAFGVPDPQLYHLLDAYFSLLMALNTRGTQQWARVLKGLDALGRILDS